MSNSKYMYILLPHRLDRKFVATQTIDFIYFKNHVDMPTKSK